MIKLLIVDDSIVFRELLINIFHDEKDIEIVGSVSNGMEALEFLAKNKIDVITMDINMPKMDGIEATKRIMAFYPTPIIILSGVWDHKDTNNHFKALEIGALTIAEKPNKYGTNQYVESSKKLIKLVKLMSEVKVVRRTHKSLLQKKAENNIPLTNNVVSFSNIKLIAIGASTGGPVVIENILANLKSDLQKPILIVQHITSGFTSGFVDWLNLNSKIKVKIPIHNEKIENGICYVAPDDHQMGIDKEKRIILERKLLVNNLCPSVDYLFKSINDNYPSETLAILLTGMGRDGAEGMRLLKSNKAITIAQDEETSIIFGMPGEAVKQNGATYILPPQEIVKFINNYL